jgi:hypothetical protein
LLVAAEGFSRQVKLPSTVEFITDSQPLFIPFGEQLWAPVMTLPGTTTQAFFLPEVCDLLLGLVWPTSIRFNDMHASAHALKEGYAHFPLVITTLQPTLSAWLNDVKDNPKKFSTLESKRYNQQSASRIPADLAIDLIGTYLKWVQEGNTLPSNSKGPLSEQSLRLYVNAAAHCLTILTNRPCTVIDPTTLQQKRVCMHPYIWE